jgi:hypothetical protein
MYVCQLMGNSRLLDICVSVNGILQVTGCMPFSEWYVADCWMYVCEWDAAVYWMYVCRLMGSMTLPEQ